MLPGARLSPDEERQLLEILEVGNVQGVFKRVQEEGEWMCFACNVVNCFLQTSVKGIRSIVSFSARKENAT